MVGLAGDLVGFVTADFDGLLTAGFDGVGVGVSDFDGIAVCRGEAVGDAVPMTFCDSGFSRVRCRDSRLSIVGNGIAVGSSTATGDLAGVGLAVGVAVNPGVGAPSGRSKRPRLCDTAGDAAEEEIGVEVTFGTGVCAKSVAIKANPRIDNARHFRMRSKAFVQSLRY